MRRNYLYEDQAFSFVACILFANTLSVIGWLLILNTDYFSIPPYSEQMLMASGCMLPVELISLVVGLLLDDERFLTLSALVATALVLCVIAAGVMCCIMRIGGVA